MAAPVAAAAAAVVVAGALVAGLAPVPLFHTGSAGTEVSGGGGPV